MQCQYELKDASPNITKAAVSIKEGLVVLAEPLCAYSFAPSTADTSPTWSADWGSISCLRFSRDERSLAVASANLIKVLDSSSGRETRTLVDHNAGVSCMCPFSRSPYQWVSGDEEGVCRVVDTRRHPSTLLCLRSSRSVSCVRTSPDDSLLVIGDHSCLQLFDLRQRKLLSRFVHSTSGVSFHPAERLMSTWSNDGLVRFWDLDSLECVSQSEPLHENVHDAFFSQSGDSLLVVCDSRLRSLSWEPCTLDWHYPLSSSPSRILYSSLDDNECLGVVKADNTTVQLLTSSLDHLAKTSTSSYKREVDVVVESFGREAHKLSIQQLEEEEKVVREPVKIAKGPSRSLSLKNTSSTPGFARNKSTVNPGGTVQNKKKDHKSPQRRSSLRNHKEACDVLALIDDDHSTAMEELQERSMRIRSIRDSARRGLNEAFSVCACESTALSLLMSHINRIGWSLSTTVSALPTLHSILTSDDKSERKVGLAALSAILHNMLPLIRNVLRNGMASSIGVDVAGEERVALCRRASDEMELLLLRHTDMDRAMDSNERQQLDSLLALL